MCEPCFVGKLRRTWHPPKLLLEIDTGLLQLPHGFTLMDWQADRPALVVIFPPHRRLDQADGKG